MALLPPLSEISFPKRMIIAFSKFLASISDNLFGFWIENNSNFLFDLRRMTDTSTQHCLRTEYRFKNNHQATV